MFLKEYSWGVEKRSAPKADNFAAIYEPFVKEMWEPRWEGSD
jgi:hypothetical protein